MFSSQGEMIMRILILLLFIFSISYSKEYVVNVINPKLEKIHIYYKTNAVLKADISVNLRPEISGRVLNIYVKEGEKVKKGQILAKIETERYSYQYKAQEFTVKKLEEIYNYNLSVFKRKEFLYKKGLISEDEYLLAQKNLKASYNDLMAAKNQLKEMQRQLKETQIKAPFDGILDKRFINVGDYVNPSTNLFYILDPKSIKAVFYLPQRFVKIVKLGDILDINVQSLGNFKGKISYISYSLTPENLIEIKADLPQNNIFKEGMYAKVKVLEKEVQAFVLPEKSVFMKDKENYVLKVENGKTKKVKVDIIDQRPGFLIVKGNLKENDNVVFEAPFGIKEGMKVKIGKKL